MRKIEPPDLLISLEPGHLAVPLSAGEEHAAVRVCLIVREQDDPAGGAFLTLRTTPQATIYLGCLADAAGRPLEWLEVWVQNLETHRLPPALQSGLTNAVLDGQWARLAEEMRRQDPAAHIVTAFENQPLPPQTLERGAGRLRALPGGAWAVCRDDAVLQAAGLPRYGESLARYLYLPAAGAETPFLALSPTALENERTRPLAQTLMEGGGGTLFNPGGGSLLVRRFFPLSGQEFGEVLGGQAWKGLENARRAFHPGGVYALLENAELLRCGTAHLFSATSGRSGRLAETLHLKLQMLEQMVRLTRAKVQAAQLPLLHLGSESFRVRLGATGLGLPFLWTGELSLPDPSLAFPLPIQNTAERYFQALAPLPASIYRPAELSMTRAGRGSVRLRKVLPSPEGVVVEGTLSSFERIGLDESQLLWLELPVPSGRLELYGFRDTAQAMAPGEAVFRTVQQQLAPEVVAALQAVAGVPFNQVPFEVLPTLSSPCDLYSLGVLGTQLLVVNSRQALPEALDAMLSLARQLASTDAGEPLHERLQKIVESDERWPQMLGPHQLREEEVPAEEARAAIPARLWWETLGTLARFFPGQGPESFCQGFGDAPGLALHAVFDAPLQTVEALARRSRALVTLEWEQNLEIATLIAATEAQS